MIRNKTTALIACLWGSALLSLQGAVLYVDGHSPGPASPYSSWGTAAATIQDALNAAADGDTILVTNGTYATGGAQGASTFNRVVITNDISLRSMNGPAVTVIDGGGSNRVVYQEHAGASLEGFTLTRGWTEWVSGAGLRALGGTVSNCWIRGNTASNSYGGGVHAENQMQFFDCRVESNAARSASTGSDRGRGGGMFFSDSSSNDLVRCIIRANHASYDGGGIYSDEVLILRACELRDNLAENRGGGLYQAYSSDSFHLRNTLFAGNESFGVGGGLNAFGGVLESCTLAGNVAGSRAGGAFLEDTTLRNTIVYGNEAPTFPDWQRDSQWGSTSATNCILGTTTGMDGVNLSSDDPLFVDPAIGDYRAAFGSPAIGAGVQDAWMTGAEDLAGNARVLDGQVDIGAYEYVPSALAVVFSATTARVEFAPVSVTFVATVGGSNTTGVGYSWDFDNDGSPDATGTGLVQVTNTYAAPGFYDVRLTVTNAAGDTADAIRRKYVKSSVQVLYASPTGSHTAPFSTPATAATNLSPAIELGWSGSTIHVASGTYELDSGLSVEEGLTLQGPEDGAPAILDGGGQFRVLNVNHTDARIRHLTITGGFTEDADGAGVMLQAGAVESCRLVGNDTDPISVTDQGGAIYMMTNTLAANCLIESNSAGQGGGVYCYRGGIVSNCVIRGNRARNSGSAGGGLYMYYGGQVLDTSVLANEGNSSTGERGAGVYITGLGRLVNSVIASNIGTGVYNDYTSDPETLIQNCTIAYNTQYGLYNSSGGDGSLRNSILYHNDNNSGNGYNLDQLVVSHCCTTPAEGSSPVAAAPDFGPGLHLLSTSPCIDAGTATDAPARDRDGLLRPLDGDGNGSALVDIGAFERADRHLEAAGNAQAIATGDSTPSTADGTDFGGVAIGETAQQTFTITNTGDHVASLTGEPRVTLTGPDAADFAVVSQPAATLAGTNGATAFTLSFSPSAGGTRQATLEIANDDWDRAPYTFDVQGEGLNAPHIRVTGNGSTITNGAAPPLASNGTAFGIARAGAGVLTNTFAVWNDGAADLILSNTTVTPGTGFAVAQAPGSPIPAGNATTVTVTFAPATVGVHRATVSIEHNEPGESPFTFAVEARAGGDVELRALGNGLWIQDGDTTPHPADNTDAGAVDLGTYTDLSFVLTNAGPDALNLLGASPVRLHQDGSAFSIQTSPASPIGGHQTAPLALRFQPTVPGVSTALVEILSDDAARPSYTFAVSATGVGEPDLSVLGRGRAIPTGDDSPTVRDNTWFGAATNGGGTVTRSFSLANGGNEPLVISDVSVGGSSDLSVPSFPGAVDPGSASNLLVHFTATSDGMAEGTLTIDSDDPNTPSYSFKIAGLGVSGPAPMTFYVRPDNPAAQAPYTNWTMAATGIAQAVDLAVGEAGIAISNGHYEVPETVLLTEPVHLYGVDAPATLDGQQAFTILEIEHPGARASGLTFRGGAPYGIAMLSGGTVSNCTFTAFGSAQQTGAGENQVLGLDPPTQDTEQAVHMPAGGLVTHSLFTSNALDNAVAITDGGEVRESTFLDNITQNGAVHIQTTGLVRRCTFRRNDALFAHDRSGGGAVTIFDGGAVLDSLVIDNSGWGGGGIHIDHGGIVENCLVVSNRAGNYTDASRTNFSHTGRGGGVFFETAGTVRHSTLAANDAGAGGLGGGLYRHSDGGTLINSIIYGNAAGTGSNWYHNNGAGSSTYTLTAPAFTGAGNIAVPAGFRDPAGDFHLAWDSPAVDAGTNTAVDSDLHGTTRPVDGDRDGTATVDMGAYELEPAILLSTGSLSVAENGTAGISIRLQEQPASSVTVTVIRASGDSDLTVSGGAELIFTTGTWDTPQFTTIAAADDPDLLDGSAVFYSRLNGTTRAAFTAVEIDDDTGGTVSRRWLFDLGADYRMTTGQWNNLTSAGSGTTVTNAVTTNGAASDVGLSITDGFSGINGSGIDTNTLYPATAQSDSFYITGFAGNQAIVRLQGLDTSRVYEVKIFASRDAGGTYTRHGRYTIGEVTNYLNAADNTTNQAVFTGVSGSNGYVDVLVEPYDSSGTVQTYSYIGVLELVEREPSGSDDQDGDGMPDWWETLYSGGPTNLVAGHDGDTDGVHNHAEYIAGTDPTDGNAYLRITTNHVIGTDITITWSSESDRVYTVEYADQLEGPYTPLPGAQDLAATPPANTHTDSSHGAAEQGFYRIRVELASP